MSSAHQLSLLDLQLLNQLGDRLRRARKAHPLGTVELAERAGISRPTLRAVESGDPNTAIGTYLRVMSALGLHGELALLASDALRPASPGSAAARARRPPSSTRVTISTDPGAHDLHDLQSLWLHKAAVDLMKQDDQLRARARTTVQGWLGKDPTARSAPLWREWDALLARGSLRKALGRSAHAFQLRQASPLPTVLPADLRQRVLDEARELKSGVVIAGAATAGER